MGKIDSGGYVTCLCYIRDNTCIRILNDIRTHPGDIQQGLVDCTSNFIYAFNTVLTKRDYAVAVDVEKINSVLY